MPHCQYPIEEGYGVYHFACMPSAFTLLLSPWGYIKPSHFHMLSDGKFAFKLLGEHKDIENIVMNDFVSTYIKIRLLYHNLTVYR